MSRSLVLTISCGVCLSAATPYCDAPPPVRSELRRAVAVWDYEKPLKERVEAIRAILRNLAEKYPNDIQANRRFQNDSQVPRQELTAKYKARYDANPDDQLSKYFYALTLSWTDAPQAMRLFEQVLEKDPSLAWAHMALAYDAANGAKPDPKAASRNVDAFFKLCPASRDFYTLRMLGIYGSPDVQAASRAAVRKSLEEETDPEALFSFADLWILEFKVTPPTAHADLRKTVAADIKRIRDAAPTPSLALLRTMVQGTQQLGDAAAVAKLEDELIQRFPTSSESTRIVMDRFRKENPFSKPTDTAEQKHSLSLKTYQAASEWVKRWPNSPLARLERLGGARGLPELPPEEFKAAADSLLDILRDNETVRAFQPFDHSVAEEYLKRKIYIAEVPKLADDGLEVVRKRHAEGPRPNMTPEMAERMTSDLRAAEVAAIDLKAKAYLQLGKPEMAKDLESKLSVLPERKAPQEQASLYRAWSAVAELDGRKLDAFAYMEKAVQVTPAPSNDFSRNLDAEYRKRLLALWTGLGGSEKTLTLREQAKPAIRQADVMSGWHTPEKPVGSWSLADLTGKQWTSDSLAGKTVLVNIWATWCGPCRAEHPEFQKLYDKLKDRSDVVVLSFNVDDQVGMVEGYLKEQKYTFPSLLAQRFVKENRPELSIPQNWIFDAKGAHKLEQIGFGASSTWEKDVMDALAKAK